MSPKPSAAPQVAHSQRFSNNLQVQSPKPPAALQVVHSQRFYNALQVQNLVRDAPTSSPMSQLRTVPYDNPRSHRHGAATDSMATPAASSSTSMRLDTPRGRAARRQTFA